MKEIRLSPDKDFLIYKVGYTPDFVRDAIKQYGLKGLWIPAHAAREHLENVEFLAEYDFLEGLRIVGFPQYSFNFLNRLGALKELAITTDGSDPIDLSTQTNLEALALQWRKNIKGLEQCRKLTKICLIEFKEANLLAIQNVENLEIVQLKTSSIKTLLGIDGLNNLQQCSIGNCRSLVSIKDLNGLQHLQTIELEACTKITDYDALTDLPQLESLRLVNCKDIPSLGFIRRFPKLRELRLLGNTKVIDGDMSPAEGIEDAYCVHFKHYTRKIESERVKAINKANREMQRQRRLENKG